MRLNDYEKQAAREVESWKSDGDSIIQHMFNLAMKPVDWVVERVVPQNLIDQASDGVASVLGMLNDASEWTYNESELLQSAKRFDIEVEKISDLREIPLERLDKFAKSHFNENAIMAAIEGGGTGLGGAVLIVADIPMLFTINFRLIQQIGGSYGFSMRSPEFQPLVLAIYNVAASASSEAKHDALKEMSVAAAAFAHNLEYRGKRAGGTFRDQQRHLPREIAKSLIGRKLGQMIPLAGAAVGAGINYWFTSQTAEATYMLFRALYVERKERL